MLAIHGAKIATAVFCRSDIHFITLRGRKYSERDDLTENSLSDLNEGANSSPGYLYVFTDQPEKKKPRFKIGSSHDPEERLKTGTTFNVDRTCLGYYGPIDHYLKREHAVHKRLQKHRLKKGGPREWYQGLNKY